MQYIKILILFYLNLIVPLETARNIMRLKYIENMRLEFQTYKLRYEF
jgi:hypothetical protein